MKNKTLKEYINDTRMDEDINEYEAEKRYKILEEYIFAGFDFVKKNKRDAFYEYLYSFILEDLGHGKGKIEHSPKFERMYSSMKERINILSIDELKYKEVVDYDYENEVLVIAFRILKYFELKDNKLFLKINKENIANVRVYNDYRNNEYICVLEEKDIDYISLKIVEERINSLRKEIEYLNDFVLNYYQEQVLDIFKITKVNFDKHDIADRFIQGEVKFTASFSIIKKLIGPLYLNKESYGMRELIQNAIDACLKKENKKGQIDISYINNDGNPCIKIKDNGIGMNEDIIINKFFTIGESTKEEGGNIGKFGIGVLATFLLADKMKFRTCYKEGEYVYESDEIELKAVQDENKFINIKKSKNKENFQGTEIVLSLKKSVIDNEKSTRIPDMLKTI